MRTKTFMDVFCEIIDWYKENDPEAITRAAKHFAEIRNKDILRELMSK